MLQPGSPDVVADRHAAIAEDHVKVTLGTTKSCRNLIDAKIRIAQMLANEGLRPDVNGLGPRTVQHPIGFPQWQQQQIDERFSDAGRRVGRQPSRLVKSGMRHVMRDPARSAARRQFVRGHFFGPEAALLQQLLRHDNDIVARQRGADDRVRRRDIIGKTVARPDLDLPAILLEIGDAIGLEQDLDVGMCRISRSRIGMCDAVLAGLDLAEFQARDGGVDSDFGR